MALTYTIRPAETCDIESISAVAVKSWQHTYSSIYPQDSIEQFVAKAYSVQSLAGSIQRDSTRAQRLFHVAVDFDGSVVAFSHVIPFPNSDTSFELARIYALPQSHGTGVGAALLTNILETVPNLKELSAWVERKNSIGRGFYERHGFKVVGEKEDDSFGYKTQLVKYVLFKFSAEI